MQERALVAGWFSFVDGHATAGDLLARDVLCNWLDRVGLPYDIALAEPFSGGVDWRRVDPTDYSHAFFVCGPFLQSRYEIEFIERFSQSRIVGINLSMVESKSVWNPFDLLLERDSPDLVRPDLVFASCAPEVPVVGICLVESYPGALVVEANEAVRRLIESSAMAVVHVDTRLDAERHNSLRNPAEVEALISVTDLLVTTRLHGMVLALKHGVPAIAIDPEPGGAKICRQAELLGWPFAFAADALDDQILQSAYGSCLSDAARAQARECAERGEALLQATYGEFEMELGRSGSMEATYLSRVANGKARRLSEANAEIQSRARIQKPGDLRMGLLTRRRAGKA